MILNPGGGGASNYKWECNGYQYTAASGKIVYSDISTAGVSITIKTKNGTAIPWQTYGGLKSFVMFVMPSQDIIITTESVIPVID